nr:hypothetical protein GCM10020093_060740 [Planobispora longispora]
MSERAKGMNLTLKVWRQNGPQDKGRMVTYRVEDVSPDMSFLEMLDVLNERLILEGDDPIAFDHDCREGICGMCGMVINGVAHGEQVATTTCQLHMRHFEDNAVITIEPWRAAPFPVVKDLVVDRSSFDRIIQAGGFISVPAGSAPDAHSVPVKKVDADAAFDAATCIGCGACVAACPNGSASSSPPPRSPTCPCSPRASPSATPAPRPWSSRWTPRASAAAPTPASARRSAPRASRWTPSPG